ncbi:MAG: hypothetical protein IJ585_14385 [Ruminococcus sp.]|nr:hypothetical protein [Ruminococcus sp.]
MIHNLNRLVLEKVLDKDANVVVQYSYTLGAAGERTKVVETGETELKTVLKVYVHSVDEILHLHTDEGDIDTTTNHPFYVIGQGWTAAGDLVEGDEVYNLDGTTSVVLGSEIEKLDECVLVYNLEVEDFHSYFVGDVPVLVHNSYDPNNSKAFIKHETYNEVRNRFGQKGVDAFIKAMNKGLVGPEGESGIKYFNGKINGILYEFEIKVKNSEFGNFRIFGNYNESLDEIIFDFFTKGQGKKHR